MKAWWKARCRKLCNCKLGAASRNCNRAVERAEKKGTSLVLSDTQMYNFDQITKEIYATRKNGITTSADALTFSKKHILLVEFKSGFKKKSS